MITACYYQFIWSILAEQLMISHEFSHLLCKNVTLDWGKNATCNWEWYHFYKEKKTHARRHTLMRAHTCVCARAHTMMAPSYFLEILQAILFLLFKESVNGLTVIQRC